MNIRIPRVCDARCRRCQWCNAGRGLSPDSGEQCGRCGYSGVEHSAGCDARHEADQRGT